jgi:hypothetical protein
MINATSSNRAAPHSKVMRALSRRSESPYQGRTVQQENPTQLITRQAVKSLLRQVEADKSATSTAHRA